MLSATCVWCYGKSSNMEEIDLVFESLCILLNTELMLPQVTKSLLDLEELVKGDLKIYISECYFIDDYPENIESETYRKTSPFGKYYTPYSNLKLISELVILYVTFLDI